MAFSVVEDPFTSMSADKIVEFRQDLLLWEFLLLLNLVCVIMVYRVCLPKSLSQVALGRYCARCEFMQPGHIFSGNPVVNTEEPSCKFQSKWTLQAMLPIYVLPSTNKHVQTKNCGLSTVMQQEL